MNNRKSNPRKGEQHAIGEVKTYWRTQNGNFFLKELSDAIGNRATKSDLEMTLGKVNERVEKKENRKGGGGRGEREERKGRGERGEKGNGEGGL